MSKGRTVRSILFHSGVAAGRTPNDSRHRNRDAQSDDLAREGGHGAHNSHNGARPQARHHARHRATLTHSIGSRYQGRFLSSETASLRFAHGRQAGKRRVRRQQAKERGGEVPAAVA